jgi:hypothetical protein
MKKHLLFIVAFLCVAQACTEEETPAQSGKTVTIKASQHGSSFLFAGLPVFFSTFKDSYSFDPIKEWSFDDGSKSTDQTVSHTFNFPGSYRIVASMHEGLRSKDTLIQIAPRLTVFGNKKAVENGKFIFQDNEGLYRIVYTYDTGTSDNYWNLLSLSPQFDSISSRAFPFGWNTEAHAAFINKSNNLTILNEKLWEVDKAGNVLKSVYLDIRAGRIIETANGYLLAGLDFNLTKILVANYDNAGVKGKEFELNFGREGYDMSSYEFENSTILRINYTEMSNAENRKHVLVRKNFLGQVISEREYPSTIPITDIVNLSSGYLFTGVESQTYGYDLTYVFTKVDRDGEVEWSIKSPLEQLYPTYTHSGQITVIEDDSFIYVFYDSQKGLKVSKSGDVIWAKRFGLSTDTFDSAIKNKAGNFVLLGSHQFDYINNEFTNSYEKRDLVVIEIDSKGNIVSK